MVPALQDKLTIQLRQLKSYNCENNAQLNAKLHSKKNKMSMYWSFGGGKLSAVLKNRLNIDGQEGRTEKAEEARKRTDSSTKSTFTLY